MELNLNLEDPQSRRTWLTQSLGSRHLGNHELNENNPGLGLEHELSKELAVALGQYRNSYNQNSNYAGLQYTPVEAGNWKLGGMGGLVTGYDAIAPVVPLAGLLAKYQNGDTGANLMAVPNPRTPKNSFIGLQVKRAIR